MKTELPTIVVVYEYTVLNFAPYWGTHRNLLKYSLVKYKSTNVEHSVWIKFTILLWSAPVSSFWWFHKIKIEYANNNVKIAIKKIIWSKFQFNVLGWAEKEKKKKLLKKNLQEYIENWVKCEKIFQNSSEKKMWWNKNQFYNCPTFFYLIFSLGIFFSLSLSQPWRKADTEGGGILF